MMRSGFVIFAPSYGMLVIEVKGDSGERPVTGCWTSIDRSEKKTC